MRRPVEFQSFPDSIRCLYGPYMAVVRKVTDGDTVDVLADLGMNTYSYRELRLLGVDAPEVRGSTREAGLAAKAFLQALTPPGTPCRILTEKPPSKEDDSFGRYLARITLEDGTDVAERLVSAGHAVYWTP